MKYVVILGDGMADYPVDAFDGKTILEVADKPTIELYGTTWRDGYG